MTEQWVELGRGATTIYYISDHGRLMSKTITQENIINLTKHRNVYVATARLKDKKHTIIIHMEVARTFIPNPHGYKYVIHLDGDTTNNHVNNLCWTDMRGLLAHKKLLEG